MFIIRPIKPIINMPIPVTLTIVFNSSLLGFLVTVHTLLSSITKFLSFINISFIEIILVYKLYPQIFINFG